MEYGVKNTQGTDRIRIVDYNRPYKQKILNGPKKIKTSFVPVIDPNTGENLKIVITLDPDGNDIWSQFIQFDTNLRRDDYRKQVGDNQEALDKLWQITSAVSPATNFLYLGFDENANNQFGTAVRLLDHKYSVYKDFVSIQTDCFIDAQGNKDETRLRYAPLPFITVIIEKVAKDSSKKITFKNVMYKVTPLLPHPEMAGFFGVEYNHAEFKPNLNEKVWEITLPGGDIAPILMQDPSYSFPMYTDAEIAAMGMSGNLNLESFNPPFTDEQIREKLNKYSLNINSVDENGKALFPHKDQLAECLLGLNVNFLDQKEKKQISTSDTTSPFQKQGITVEQSTQTASSNQQPLFADKELASDQPIQQTVTKRKEAPDDLPEEKGFNPDQPTPTGSVKETVTPSFLKK